MLRRCFYRVVANASGSHTGYSCGQRPGGRWPVQFHAQMIADIYKPDLWNSFFIMVGGGSAALMGLVFVALSIALSLDLEDMTEDATHRYRSVNTLAGLTAVFLTCGLVLMPGQNHEQIGLEVFIVGLTGALIFLYGFRQAFKFGSQPSKLRLVVGTCLYFAELIGALISDLWLHIGSLCSGDRDRRKRGIHDFGSMVTRCECVQRTDEKIGVRTSHRVSSLRGESPRWRPGWSRQP